jgi:hypothetical protein
MREAAGAGVAVHGPAPGGRPTFTVLLTAFLLASLISEGVLHGALVQQAPGRPLLREPQGGGGGGALDAVLGRHGSRLTAATWGEGGSAPPVFFLTAARAWGGGAKLQAARDEQYATNIGNILSLGFPVFVCVSPGPPPEPGQQQQQQQPSPGFPLLEELAAASPPGQLRVHYCSQDTAVRRRSGGADEVLCMQEAIPALLERCLLPVEPYTPLASPPRGCPSADTHVIRMSGRYLMAKYDVLRAVHARGDAVDAFFKFNANWTENNPAARTVDPEWQPLNLRQVITFMISMKVREGKKGAARFSAPFHLHPPPHTHTRTSHFTYAHTHLNLVLLFTALSAQALCSLPHDGYGCVGRVGQRLALRVALRH